MSKRKGRKPLNYDNPDEDSEPEEAGTMVLADEGVIRNRVMKVAKRRLVNQQPEGGVFNSLKAPACLKSQPSINLESTFAFLKNNTGGTSVPSSGAITSNSNPDSHNGKFSSNFDSNMINRLNNASAQPKSDLSFKRAYVESPESSMKHSYSLPSINSNKSPSPSAASGDNRRQVDVKELADKDASNPILERVKILNIECLQWAQQHVDEDPCVDLRLVFKDYNQHFEAILEEFHKSEANKPKEINASSETLVKLQNHIKTKNQMESSKDTGKKSNDYCSSTNDIYSPDSDAEMKSKISQSLDRLSYFSSLLGNNSAANETVKTDAGTPTRVSVATPTSNLDSSPKTQSPVVGNTLRDYCLPPAKADSGSTGLAFGRSSSGNFSFGTDAPKPALSASPVTQASDNKSPASTGSFFKIPALEKNCFSNPSPLAKESAESKEKSPFGSTAAPVGAFSLSSGSGSFGAPQQKTETEEEADDEDQPPVVEVKPIIEEGAKYTARCKVFIKKEDNSYADKGVGTLSLKCLDNSNKHQLVIRAESTLGNILVNVLVSKDIPIQRTGKNNVLLVCLPTPESDPPPKVVLLRVKTEAEANELYNVLKDTQDTFCN